MSLSERNPYEVHAELLQRIERLETEVERLRAAILAYDDAIRKASWRGQRVIDDDDNLDERYAQMLLAAGREPEAT